MWWRENNNPRQTTEQAMSYNAQRGDESAAESKVGKGVEYSGGVVVEKASRASANWAPASTSGNIHATVPPTLISNR